MSTFCVISILLILVFQCIQEKQQEESRQNFSQKYNIMQKENYLKEQLLTNKTLEYGILKNQTLQQKKEIASLFKEKMRCHRKQGILSKSLQNTGKLYDNRWSCCGVNCYYFTTENKDWRGCKQTCESYNLSLLKIDDEDELAFVQPQTYRDSYWIGLSYNAKESKWKWIDNGTFSGTNLKIIIFHSGIKGCAFLTATKITAIDCDNEYKCICEKRIDSVLTACFN